MNDYGKAYVEYKAKQKVEVKPNKVFEQAELLAARHNEDVLRLAAVMSGIVAREKVQKARELK